MRGLIWIPSLTACWFGLGGCFYVHDDDCSSNLDCHTGRICQQGQCLDASDAEDSSGGVGGGEGTGPAPNSSSTGSDEEDGPACEGIQSGTQVAALPDVESSCTPARRSFSAVFGAGSLLESADGRECSLSDAGTDCYETFPDTYECGGCSFDVYLSQLYYEGEQVDVAYVIKPDSCSGGCADYCCVSEGIAWVGEYWLPQTPSGG